MLHAPWRRWLFSLRDQFQQHAGLLVFSAALLSTPVVELAKKLKPLFLFSGKDLVKH